MGEDDYTLGELIDALVVKHAQDGRVEKTARSNLYMKSSLLWIDS